MFTRSRGKPTPVMVAYNVNLLKENGIDPRSLLTYSGFLKAAEKMAKDTDGDGRIDQWLYSPSIDVTWVAAVLRLLHSIHSRKRGAKNVARQRGRVAFEDDAAVEVFTFLKTLFDKKLVPKGALIGDQFLGGRIATTITGPYSVPYYDQNAPEGFEYDFQPVPVPDGHRGPVVNLRRPAKNIGIFANTKHHP